ncbi:hypothetical protein HDU67_002728 [Dinochytrium kinnereticum]|nr:hypothetical protein HDU67_002728 [Dinochytrium kinnereticum]
MTTVSYAISQETVHKFLAHVTEDAIKTYTLCLDDIENGKIKHWAHKPAPRLAIE